MILRYENNNRGRNKADSLITNKRAKFLISEVSIATALVSLWYFEIIVIDCWYQNRHNKECFNLDQEHKFNSTMIALTESIVMYSNNLILLLL